MIDNVNRTSKAYLRFKERTEGRREKQNQKSPHLDRQIARCERMRKQKACVACQNGSRAEMAHSRAAQIIRARPDFASRYCVTND